MILQQDVGAVARVCAAFKFNVRVFGQRAAADKAIEHVDLAVVVQRQARACAIPVAM